MGFTGILTRNPMGWCSVQLQEAFSRRGVKFICFRFQDIVAHVGFKPIALIKGVDVLKDVDAIIIRPIGRGSLDECVFRMDVLHRLSRFGVYVVNHPSAIERCVDKYYALALLEERGLPVPKTVVTENIGEALRAFREFSCDVIVKPVFGSRGHGVTRINDPDVARTVFHSLSFVHNVLYVQEFIPHGTRDIRAFVVGDEVIAAMYRESASWKTNVSMGGRPRALKPEGEFAELAIKAAKTLGCEVAGVDIMEGANGFVVNEVNSQPGWMGLQTVTRINIADKIVDYVLLKSRK